MLKKIENRIILFTLISAIIYILLALATDFDSVFSSLLLFRFSSIIFLALFVVLGFLAKFLRWKYYLYISDIELGLKEELLIFLSGLIMAFSPGKIGEIIKSLLLKNKHDIKYSKTVPIIIFERMTEFFALVIIVTAGLLFFELNLIYVFAGIVVTALFVLLFSSGSLKKRIFKKIINLPQIKDKVKDLIVFNEQLSMFSKPGPILYSTLLSILGWIFEFISFYIVIINFEPAITLVWSGFIYSASIILGAVSMLPGGIGTTEAALTYILTNNGIPENSAAASTIIIRIATLWISVVIGFLSLIYYIWLNKVNIDE